MNEIDRIHTSLDSIESFTEKNKLVNHMNSLIIDEKSKLTKLLEKIECIDNFKIPTKYKKQTIDELEKLLYSTTDIDEKIIIYSTIQLMVQDIRKTIID